MKTLGALVTAEHALAAREEIRTAVLERFDDVAISVREEAVRLAGGFVLQGYDVSYQYLDGLLVRLRDKGVSVRKAVVGIVRDILLQQPTHPRYNCHWVI